MREKPQIKKRGPSWVLIRPLYGLRASQEELPFPSQKAALRASQGRDGGFVGQERAYTPEHGPDYYGNPARYWPVNPR